MSEKSDVKGKIQRLENRAVMPSHSIHLLGSTRNPKWKGGDGFMTIESIIMLLIMIFLIVFVIKK